jgi:hypothetical protein
MRRTALLLLGLIPFCAHAEDRSLTEDGTFWNSLSDTEKVHFLIGFVNGYNAGVLDLRIPIEKSRPSDATVKTIEPLFDTSQITFGTLEAGVDKCYSDFRNSRLNVQSGRDWRL